MQCGLCVQGSPKKITDDVAALRPTLFIAVPRVLERIQAGIDAKVQLLPDANAQSSRHPCCLPAPMQDQTPAFRHLIACACGLQRHAANAGSAVQCFGSWVAWVPLQVKGKGLVTRVIFALAFRWKQLRIKMGAAVESVSTCFRAPLSTLVSGPA